MSSVEDSAPVPEVLPLRESAALRESQRVDAEAVRGPSRPAKGTKASSWHDKSSPIWASNSRPLPAGSCHLMQHHRATFAHSRRYRAMTRPDASGAKGATGPAHTRSTQAPATRAIHATHWSRTFVVRALCRPVSPGTKPAPSREGRGWLLRTLGPHGPPTRAADLPDRPQRPGRTGYGSGMPDVDASVAGAAGVVQGPA